MEEQIKTVETSSPEGQQFQYAGFGRRFLAYFVDIIIVSLVVGSFSASFTFASGGSGKSTIIWLPSVLITAAYYIFFWVKYDGQTLGKRLMAVKVIKEDGSQLDFSVAIVRYIGYIISGFVFFLGFIWVAFDSKKQGWHDKIAKTLVVKTDQKPKTKLVVLILVLVSLLVVVVVGLLSFGMFKIFESVKENPEDLRKIEKFIEEIPGADTSTFKLSQSEADSLAYKVFDEINEHRSGRGLPTIAMDSRLCAYAQRRLQQISQLGRYDDAKGLYEDMSDTNTAKAYFFPSYARVGENYHPLTSLIIAGDIVSTWATGEKANINDVSAAQACVRADTESILVIIGFSK